MSLTRSTLGALAAAAALALFLVPSPLRAGCLAPFDQAIDASQGTGPFWGNDSRSLLYARKGSVGAGTLILRSGVTGAPIAVGGQENGFFAGAAPESWDVFHSGTINADDDAAFVASTTIPDVPTTDPDEHAVLRRGAYAYKGGRLFEIARFGKDSPISDGFGGFTPWGSVFDAFAADRDDLNGDLDVIFSAQLAGAVDRRLGLWRWSDAQPATTSPVLLSGDVSPAGGAFSAFGRLRGDGAGDAVFFATTKLTADSPDTPGIFLLPAGGSPLRVVKFGTAGDAAPGGGTFFLAGDFDVDDAGVVTFSATVHDGARASALYRASPPSYQPSLVLSEGDPSPLGGSFGPFGTSIVRSAAGGEVVFSVTLSDDVGGVGIFSIAPGATAARPLVPTEETLAIAPLGAGAAAYTTGSQVRTVVPADGTEQGPTNFRVFNLDQKNAVALKKDSIVFEGRFMVPTWDTTPPAVFRGDATRQTSAGTLSGAQLSKIVEVKASVAQLPGNNFVFTVGGTDAAPVGSFKYNGGVSQPAKKLVLKSDGSRATWTFDGSPGAGSLDVDLEAGKFKLTVSKATINPSYDAPNFRVFFVLRSGEDVAQSRADADSYLHADLLLDGTQAPFGSGRRVVSKGEVVDGGTVYVDLLRATRKPAAKGKPATDQIQLAGVIRLCPGSIAVAAPSLPLTLRVGDFRLDGVTMDRVGKSGASYRYKSGSTDFRLDLVKGTFTLKATTPPQPDLIDAAGTTGTNNSKSVVGGMKLAFALSIPLVYDVQFAVPMKRLIGGKVFSR